jgi:hypothetical protein
MSRYAPGGPSTDESRSAQRVCRAGERTGAWQQEPLQIACFEVVSKTVKGASSSRVQIPPPRLSPCRVSASSRLHMRKRTVLVTAASSPPKSSKIRDSPLPAVLTGERLAHGTKGSELRPARCLLRHDSQPDGAPPCHRGRDNRVPLDWHVTIVAGGPGGRTRSAPAS